MTLRQELNGEKKGGGKTADVKSVLRMQHLQKVALWAGGEAGIPSLAAFLGNRSATCGEATGVPLDPSLFPCQKCETILQPGFNCSVRVETNGAKVRRRRNKSCTPTKNVVVYRCHFCSHRNVKKGTSKRHMKEILASKPKPDCKTEFTSIDPKVVSCARDTKASMAFDKIKVATMGSEPMTGLKSNPNSPAVHTEPRKDGVENSPITPKLTLLESKRKKRKGSSSVLKEQVDQSMQVTPNTEKAAGGSSKKRKKGWSSLKEIALNSESTSSPNLTNLTLPFLL